MPRLHALAHSVRSSLVSSLWLWISITPLVLLAAPSAWFLLPNFYSALGENYEPLKTLRFAASFGADYHKYGPMTSFLLLPPYAASLGWWWLRGTFSIPSRDFPYGFADPLWQLTWLILEARLLFAAVFIGGCILMLRESTKLAARSSVSLAFLLCVSTSYAAAMYVANDRPDGPAFGFVAAALAMYVRLLTGGPHAPTASLMSVLAVFAISCKELAGPLFVLPYLGLLVHFLRATRCDPAGRRAVIRVALSSAGAGVITYLIVNVIYAPAVWWLRMEHWLAGEGTSKGVWRGAEESTLWGYTTEHFGSFLNALGPGGMAAVVFSGVALLVLRPRFAGMLLLPFVSILFLGLVPLSFPGERFYVFATIALVPPVALGFDSIRKHLSSGAHLAVGGALAVLALVSNFVLGTFAWHQLDGVFPRAVERSLVSYPISGGSVNLFSYFPEPEGKSRLAWLGYRVDPRSIQQIMDAHRADRPRRIYVSQGELGFLEGARSSAERVAFLLGEGFDATGWHGLEGLGYRLVGRFETETPWWFPYDFVPGVVFWRERNPILIYELDSSGG